MAANLKDYVFTCYQGHEVRSPSCQNQPHSPHFCLQLLISDGLLPTLCWSNSHKYLLRLMSSSGGFFLQVKGIEVLTHDSVPVAYTSSPEELVCSALPFFFLSYLHPSSFSIIILRLDYQDRGYGHVHVFHPWAQGITNGYYSATSWKFVR